MNNTKVTKKAARKPLQRAYWPNCSVCQFLKKNKDIRDRIMQSTYFNPLGNESLLTIFHEVGDPFPPTSIYTHIQRHQTRDIIKAEKRLTKATTNRPVISFVDDNNNLVGPPQHVLGLDEFIREGREKLATGELGITSSTYLQAIKVKADIEKSTKDRRADLFKTMFKGAAPIENN